MAKLLEVNNLQTGFKNSNDTLKVVRGIDFHLEEGEILGIVGESGSGKSVTALSIMRLLHDTPGEILSGEVNYKGTDLTKLTEKQMRKYRGKEVSMIFQEPMTTLNPVLKIGRQMKEVILLHTELNRKQAHQHAVETLESVGIPRAKDIMNEYPHQLSGGMRQRVVIAMQISCNPSLLIADEPTTALDVTIQKQILKLLKDIQKKTGMGIIFITHDLGVVSKICDRVNVMYAGEIVESAETRDLFNHPKHPYTKGLIESIPKLGHNQERLSSIPGTVPNLNDMPKGCTFSPRCNFVMDRCHAEHPDFYETDNISCRCFLYDQIAEERMSHV
ncbi:ABC transporter ATP-binding protein [Salinicoccus hispanicus]|uniref:ATP-binding cassette domain-containing protein n=1 Tax=Salinicoccus hispanicus TaxID=157225 RepID=A0A6N8U125_9STAP|nr:ABC transporter ATP-binding protein [Salinicoccus hispanicus]MXQ51037.1 ATP-binding cassette domain-containing protein [Salinicoccus hispanicus]